MRRLLLVAIAIAIAQSTEPAVAQMQTPSAPVPIAGCAKPNEPPKTLSAANVFTPPGAVGSADVEIRIALDAQSKLVNASIYASTDPTYNDAALRAATASRFATEVVGCQPKPAAYRFIVVFKGFVNAAGSDSKCPVRNSPAQVLVPRIPHGRLRLFATPGTDGLFDAQVRVDLDEQSNILHATVISSNDPEFAQAALVAARATTFKTAIVDCEPVKQSIIYHVQHSMNT